MAGGRYAWVALLVVARAHEVVEIHPATRMRAPEAVISHQMGWVAREKSVLLARLTATTVPATATPRAAPT